VMLGAAGFRKPAQEERECPSLAGGYSNPQVAHHPVVGEVAMLQPRLAEM